MNLGGPEGGYQYSCLQLPERGVYEGFMDPVCKYMHSKLRVRRSGPGENGRWRVDQSAMLYCVDPPLTPRIGESLAVRDTQCSTTPEPKDVYRERRTIYAPESGSNYEEEQTSGPFTWGPSFEY